jgi:hypothetical protein
MIRVTLITRFKTPMLDTWSENFLKALRSPSIQERSRKSIKTLKRAKLMKDEASMTSNYLKILRIVRSKESLHWLDKVRRASAVEF